MGAQTNTVIGPGKLVLVVGPSGAGKDTLLSLARAACADDPTIVFVQRVVTREASSAEDNEQITADAFREACARGAFAIHWEAHGHAYGLPRSIEDDIRAGRIVIANVSRTVIRRCATPMPTWWWFRSPHPRMYSPRGLPCASAAAMAISRSAWRARWRTPSPTPPLSMCRARSITRGSCFASSAVRGGRGRSWRTR
jgi:energy-coupling factor transporter ATP-binding protein EcfA2